MVLEWSCENHKKEDGICINVFVCVCKAQPTDSFLIRMDSYWIPMGILWFPMGSYQFHMGPPLLVCPVLCEAQKKGFVVVVGQCM